PKQTGNLPEVSFSEIAVKVLESFGFEPVECVSDDEAKSKIRELLPQKKWPCLFLKSDTTGEKDLEEFIGDHDQKVNYQELKNMYVVKRIRSNKEKENFEKFSQLFYSPRWNSLSKEQIVHAISEVVPSLTHTELNKNLDSKM